MEYLGSVTIVVLIWLVIFGGSLSAFTASTRYAIRQARVQWLLPPKIWSVLVVGLTLQLAGMLSFALALLVWFLTLQSPNNIVVSILLTIGFIGIELGSVVLVIWLGIAHLTQSRSYPKDTPNDALARRNSAGMLIVLLSVCVTVSSQGFMIGFLFNAWPIGLAASFPVAAYIACLGALLAHTLNLGVYTFR